MVRIATQCVTFGKRRRLHDAPSLHTRWVCAKGACASPVSGDICQCVVRQAFFNISQAILILLFLLFNYRLCLNAPSRAAHKWHRHEKVAKCLAHGATSLAHHDLPSIPEVLRKPKRIPQSSISQTEKIILPGKKNCAERITCRACLKHPNPHLRARTAPACL